MTVSLGLLSEVIFEPLVFPIENMTRIPNSGCCQVNRSRTEIVPTQTVVK